MIIRPVKIYACSIVNIKMCVFVGICIYCVACLILICVYDPVFVHMYMCLYVSTYVRVYVGTYVGTYVRVCGRVYSPYLRRPQRYHSQSACPQLLGNSPTSLKG